MLYTKLKHKTKELKELTKLGVVSTKWLRDIRIFEKFHGLPDMCNDCKYIIIGEEEGLESETIRKIINKMKS